MMTVIGFACVSRRVKTPTAVVDIVLPPYQEALDVLAHTGLDSDWYTLHAVQRVWWTTRSSRGSRGFARDHEKLRTTAFNALHALSPAAWVVLSANDLTTTVGAAGHTSTMLRP